MRPWLLALVLSLPAVGEAGATGAGVVVESVHAGGAAASAGVEAGDLLLSWRREAAAAAPAAAGVFADPFEVVRVELEEAPLGGLELCLRRREEERCVRPPPAPWVLATRPPFVPADRQAAYDTGLAQERAGEVAGAVARWDELTRDLRADGAAPVVLAWLHLRRGGALVGAAKPDEARAAFEDALAFAPGPLAAAVVHDALGDLFVDRVNDFDRAEEHYREALALHRTRRGEHLAFAETLKDLIFVHMRRDHPDEAEALAAQQRRLLERLAPASWQLATALHNEAYLAFNRGDLLAADEGFQRALALKRELSPQAHDHATLLMLARIAQRRGELERSEELSREAVAAMRRTQIDPLAIASGLVGLANSLEAREKLAEALELQREAAELRRRAAPESIDFAASLGALGRLARKQGLLDEAGEHLRGSLASFERLAPGGLSVGTAHHALALLAIDRGELERAASHLEQAVALRQRWSPGTLAEAEALQSLAQVRRRQGRRDDAVGAYGSAVEALEKQRYRLGGAEPVRSRFGARHNSAYWELAELLTELGRGEEAFGVHERGRARVFLDTLAERRIAFDRELPAELARERAAGVASYEQALRGLARLDAKATNEARAAAETALGEARQRMREIEERVRVTSPRLASVSYPQPLDLAATRRALPASTLLLSYAVGERATLLFAVGPGNAFAVHRVAGGSQELGAEVDRWRRLLMRPGGELRASGRLAGQRLSELLLSPVAAQLATAELLLVVPDGPLHALPFAALPAPADAERSLVEVLPLAFSPSATTVAGLLAAPRAATPAQGLVAFADPRHPDLTGRDAPAALRGLARLGEGALPALPGARREAERIAGGWPGQTAVWVGEEATEGRAKRLDGAAIVHFACHALVDPEHPLESGLVLAPSAAPEGAENGLLQAWEIYESASFDADLVTLSACDTGLGQSLAGEGVLGLTRAFHYAGADSVLATLWPVTDHHTAVLMEELYRQLAAGVGRAEALRRAQLSLLRSGAGGGHPYHWAGYQLSGDWR